MNVTAGLMVGWNRTVSGQEREANSKFGEFAGYLGTLQAEGIIANFEPVLLHPNGGALSGFFLVRGDPAKLASLRQTDAWKDWVAWGNYRMMGFSVTECDLGNAVTESMTRFAKLAG